MCSRSLFAVFLIASCALASVLCKIDPGFSKEDLEENEFADFEEFDDETPKVLGDPTGAPKPSSGPDASRDPESTRKKAATPERDAETEDEETSVEDEESDDFEHLQDTDEFEGYDADRPSRTHGKTGSSSGGSGGAVPEIKIAKVPFMHTRWDSYVMEMMILSGIAVYVINFLLGRAKNGKIAQAWFNVHRQVLEENFALVGDDGRKDAPTDGCGLVKESEHLYTLWCSGRVCCEGMLVELKLLKRQDLVSIVAQFFKRSNDLVEIKVHMGPDDMDSFVTFAGQKKSAGKIAKEMNDLATYGGEKRTGEKYGLPSSYVVLSEIGEGTQAVLDARAQAVMKKNPGLVEYIHVSDQFSGPKLSDDAGSQLVKLPDGKRVIRVGVNFPCKPNGTLLLDEVESMRPVLLLVFHLVEKLKRFRLSKESKQKAEKNRSRVEESFLKTTHQARAEAAAQRREERRRMEKERMMAEEDPDKQRRWEEKESRRQMKKKQPRIKQLKVKAL